MRTFLIGCGVIVMLIFGGVIYVGWKGVSMFRQMAGEIEEVTALYAQTNQEHPFSPPEGGTPGADQLDRWLRVRGLVSGEVEQMTAAFESEEASWASVRQLISMPARIGREHVAALREAGMSAREYGWITGSVIGALNSGDARADARFAALIDKTEELGEQYHDHSRSLLRTGHSLTSDQLAQLLPLLAERSEQILETSRVFLLDLFVLDHLNDGPGD